MNAKSICSTILLPLAQLACYFSKWHRIWAHARLTALLAKPVKPSVVILGVPEVHGTANIQLGEDLFLYRDLYLETQGDGSIEIGDDVVISRGVHLVSHSRIEIGSYSMIGEYASIRDANHRFGAHRLVRNSGYKATPIQIGKNVWIGRGVTILRGVKIGDNAVIGANAVITHDVACNSVVVGVPAYPIRQEVQV